MKRTAIPLAVVALLAASPVWAQGNVYTQDPATQELALAQEQDVLTVVQQELGQRGYNVTATGQFDAATRNGVLRFQSDTGLRPTGNVDLSTLAALGINVDPAYGQGVAAAPPQTAGIVDDNSVDYPLLKDEHMTSPQTGLEEGDRFQNSIGVPQPRVLTEQGDIAGLPPGFPEENLVH